MRANTLFYADLLRRETWLAQANGMLSAARLDHAPPLAPGNPLPQLPAADHALHELWVAQNESVYQLRRARRLSPMQAAISASGLIMRKHLPDWRSYLLPLMFLKYASETWFALRGQYIAQFPAQPLKIASSMAAERFILPRLRLPALPPATRRGRTRRTRAAAYENCHASFHALYERREQADIAQLIDQVLAAWEASNPARLQGIFTHLQFDLDGKAEQAETRRGVWRAVLGEMARFDLHGAAARSEFCLLWQQLLQEPGLPMASEEDVLPHLMLRVLSLSAIGGAVKDIADPFCGNGELLHCLAQHYPACHFWGQESDPAQLAHARMGLLLYGEHVAELASGNSLRQPGLLQGQRLQHFDWQLSNLARYRPHWDGSMLQHDQWQRFTRGMIPKGKPELACICHMLETATERGRIAVLMQSGCLFRKGGETALRKKLLAENVLDALILLPAGLQGARPLALVILQKGRAAQAPVLMMDTRQHSVPRRGGSSLNQTQLERICHTLVMRSASAGYACLVTPQQITAHDDNWMPSIYLQTNQRHTARRSDSLPKVAQEIVALREQLENLEKVLAHQFHALQHMPP